MFYAPNVETYLHRDGKWSGYCANLLAMPFDDPSVLVRPSGPSGLPGGIGVVAMSPTVEGCR